MLVYLGRKPDVAQRRPRRRVAQFGLDAVHAHPLSRPGRGASISDSTVAKLRVTQLVRRPADVELATGLPTVTAPRLRSLAHLVRSRPPRRLALGRAREFVS